MGGGSEQIKFSCGFFNGLSLFLLQLRIIYGPTIQHVGLGCLGLLKFMRWNKGRLT